MANEIDAHRLFISAETRQLELNNEPIIVKQIIDSVCTLYSGSQMTNDKNISIKSKVEEFALTTDKRILYRIIENLVKNAIEASPANSTVEVLAHAKNDNALFTVPTRELFP